MDINKGRVGARMRFLGRHWQGESSGKHVLDGSCICCTRLLPVMVVNLGGRIELRIVTRFVLLVFWRICLEHLE